MGLHREGGKGNGRGEKRREEKRREEKRREEKRREEKRREEKRREEKGLILVDSNSQFLPGFQIQVPRKVIVQAGLCVHIPCTFTIPSVYKLSRNAKGIWHKADTAKQNLFTFKDDFANEKFIVTGAVWEGDCSLRINDARSEDSDHYIFRFVDIATQYSFLEGKLYVEVVELTDIPEISPAKRFAAGEKVMLTCTSPGRCSGKSPQITWEGDINRRNIQSYTVNHEDGSRTYHSNITFIPTIEDDQSSLTCKVTFVDSGTSSNSIFLSVEDNPSIVLPASDCGNVDSKIIAGIVAGNVIILILISLGLFCFLKRYMEKRPLAEKLSECTEQTEGGKGGRQTLMNCTTDQHLLITDSEWREHL
ncbi:sialic acid-binding Ig-like lectin 13 [Pseudophryne corroboree]|uniref:sialic acid-binding Ig-like lectin 13 n=1 Tax=Pseudophryne corroboree TaxID=495146 RepID=UPI00308163E0